MNTYAKRVMDYLDEETIAYSCEEMGTGDESLLIYAAAEGAPNIWAEIDSTGEIQLTIYLAHGMGEEERQLIQDRNYVIQTSFAEYHLFIDEEGSVTALYNTTLELEHAGEDFVKALYAILFAVNQCIADILMHAK